MGEIFEVSPSSLQTGTAISVVVKFSDPYSETQYLNITKSNGNFSLQAPLNFVEPTRATTQFALFEAGIYRLTAGNAHTLISVTEQRDLPFLLEFGLLSFLVIFALGGLVKWNQSRIKRK
jgi:hypothetical protein